MKKLFLVVLLVVNLFALGSNNDNNYNKSYNTKMPNDHKKLVNKIIGELDIPLDANLKKVKSEIYKHVKFALKNKWYTKWRSNITPSNAKFKNSSTRFVDMVIINEKFLLNVIFIHFRDANQVYVTTLENHKTSYKNAIKIYNKYKNKSTHVEKHNSNTSAYLKKKNFMSSAAFLVNSPNGFVQYINSFVFSTK